MKVKEESEKVGLKLNIQKTSIMTSTRHFMAIWWRNNGNNERLYPLGLQNHCRWWLQPWNYKRLVSWRKAMTKLDSIWKSRDITLPTKVHLVKAMISPVVMYGCETWTIKKAEYWRIDASELWCWRRLLRVPWTARRSNQSILKEISPEYSLEGLMLKLKLLILWPHDGKNWLTGKDPDAGKYWWKKESALQRLGQETSWKRKQQVRSACCCCHWVTQSCPTLWDPMDCSTPGFLVLHHLPELA